MGKQPAKSDVVSSVPGVVPDRAAVPNSVEIEGRQGLPPHRDTNEQDGLTDPDVEAKAPGRTTHGATNNR